MKNKVAWVDSTDYSKNNIRNAFDSAFEALGMQDFSDIVKPGMTVFIKPNWVASRWRESCPYKDDIYSVITHPSIIEETADRVAKALNGSGRIIIGDNPSIDADFDELIELTGLKRLESKYSVSCKLVDLRPLVCKDLIDYGQRDKMEEQSGDPFGEITVNLAEESLFYGLDNKLFHGVFDNYEESHKAHNGNTQIYTFSRSIFDSDLYLSIPKMKTHHKTGVTLNIKGLVGAVTQKDQLIHWQDGYPEIGGDAYPNKEAFIASEKQKVKKRGAWEGNDTIWRMVVDLYHIFYSKKRKTLTIIDGITAGEGAGPFCPKSKKANTLIFSENLLAADLVATRLMGIDFNKVRYLNYLIKEDPRILQDISVIRDKGELKDFFNSDSKYLDFKVANDWENIKI